MTIRLNVPKSELDLAVANKYSFLSSLSTLEMLCIAQNVVVFSLSWLFDGQ